MKWFVVILMLFVSNVLSEESVNVYDDIIDKRVEWIIEHTEYVDYGYPRPVIILSSQANMESLWESITGYSYNGHIRAIHVWDDTLEEVYKSTIYLPLDFNIDLITDQRTLTHEVTHYLQHRQNNLFAEDDNCIVMLEYYARQIANRYIKEEMLSIVQYVTKNDNELQLLEGTCR